MDSNYHQYDYILSPMQGIELMRASDKNWCINWRSEAMDRLYKKNCSEHHLILKIVTVSNACFIFKLFIVITANSSSGALKCTGLPVTI